MVQCQNCGQVNNYGSNFCRFCGTRMVIPQNPPQMRQQQSPPYPPQINRQSSEPFEYKAPRPYVWKTDEFQLPEATDKKNRQINQVQPLANFTAPQPQHGGQSLSPYHQPSPITSYGYRCPQCGTQNAPLYTKKISSAGWIVFAVLLVMFFPLFWIGFLIKEDVQICPVCNMRVG